MANPWNVTKALTAADDDNIAASQSPGAGAITLNGAAVTSGVAILDTQRQVILTSGGNDSGITFTVNGTNGPGNPISEAVTGAGIGIATTTLNFKTVTSVTHTGSVAGTLKIGTNTVGSTDWFFVDRYNTPMNFGMGCVVSGTVNYTVEYTYDDPNAPYTATFPTAFSLAGMTAKSATADDYIDNPFSAIRLTINSGTGTVKMILLPAGWGAA